MNFISSKTILAPMAALWLWAAASSGCVYSTGQFTLPLSKSEEGAAPNQATIPQGTAPQEITVPESLPIPKPTPEEEASEETVAVPTSVVHPECPYLAEDEPVTKVPIPAAFTFFTHFAQSNTEPAGFAEDVETMKINPAQVHAEMNWSLVPFLWGPWTGGSWSTGVQHEIWGDASVGDTGYKLDQGLLPPAKLQERIDRIKDYLKNYEGWTKIFPYTDFGTQITGNHLDRTGFWAFYDHWDQYKTAFNLGERPSDPTTWLKEWWNGDVMLPNDYPASLAGFSFDYGPAKCRYDSLACRATYSPIDCSAEKMRPKPQECSEPTYYRYSINVLSSGWEAWWKFNFRNLAEIGFPGAYIDNAAFANCWNQECDDAYRSWVTANIPAADLVRFSSGAPSLVTDSGFETGWKSTNGVWSTFYSGVTGGAKLFPDADAPAGLYAARIENEGTFTLNTVKLDAGQLNRDYEILLSYKTAGEAEVTLSLTVDGKNQNILLAASEGWTNKSVTIHPTTSEVGMNFKIAPASASTSSTPTLWLDEIILREPGTSSDPMANFHLPTHPEILYEFSGKLKTWAMLKTFKAVLDDRITFLRNAAREVNPNFQLWTNSRHPIRGADYFLVEDHAEDFEAHFQNVSSEPGVYRPGPTGDPAQPVRQLKYKPVTSELLVTNVFDYKLNHSLQSPDFFGYAVHATRHYPYFAHNLDSLLLKHAEVAAFGGGAGIDPGLLSGYYLYADKAKRTALHTASKDFFSWVDAHKDLYECLRPAADVALIYHDVVQENGLPLDDVSASKLLKFSQELASRGLLWDVLGDEKKITAAKLARYKVLVYQGVQRLPDDEAKLLKDFMNAGGVVIAGGATGQYDQYFRLRAVNATNWPPVPVSATADQTVAVGEGLFVSLPGGLSASSTVLQSTLTSLQGDFSILPSLTGTDLARMRVAGWEGYKKTVLHFVNYNVPLGAENGGQVQTLTDVAVKLKPAPGLTPTSVTLYSPESGSTSGDVPFEITADGSLTFTIPALKIYGAAVVSY